MQEIHRIRPNPIKNLRNPQRSTHHLFPDAPPPLPPPTRPHLLQAKAAKERADAAAVEKEASEKAAAEAIVYIKCPHCRHLCYIFWRMSGWALISVCCWNQDRFHWQILDDTMDGIIKSPPESPALRRFLFGPIWLKIAPRTIPSCRSCRDLQNPHIILSNGAVAIHFTPKFLD